MLSNQFFEKKGPFPLRDIIKSINCSGDFSSVKNEKIFGLANLAHAKKNEITFLHSNKYADISLKTKASFCITSSNLSKFLPKNCIILNVKNVLFATTQVSRMFFPQAILDYPDLNLINSKKLKKKYPKVFFGENVLVGKNVKIGKNTSIGSYTIIESNVSIGDDCLIGSFVKIKNSLVKNNVNISDGSIIGIKGFGFIPIQGQNIRTPQIGKVVLDEYVEIGANCTIDRGSMDDTVIGKNTFLDNQIQIAHNVKVGQNCIIASQVGIAGSTIIGDNVMIGGKTGVSGHLKIGNNVKIGGGSGVIKDIPDNSQVMGYPSVSLRDFVKGKVKNEK